MALHLFAPGLHGAHVFVLWSRQRVRNHWPERQPSDSTRCASRAAQQHHASARALLMLLRLRAQSPACGSGQRVVAWHGVLGGVASTFRLATACYLDIHRCVALVYGHLRRRNGLAHRLWLARVIRHRMAVGKCCSQGTAERRATPCPPPLLHHGCTSLQPGMACVPARG